MTLKIYDVFPNQGQFELVIMSENKKILELIVDNILLKSQHCENCNGQVQRSGEAFLCLSGCGHVEGIGNTTEKTIKNMETKS